MTVTSGGGVLFAVVGPSGAGKDSVIDHARATLAGEPSIVFVRRVINRPEDGAGENHEPVSDAEFDARQARGAFCVHWRAHGLRYGLPAALKDHVDAGGHAIANLSRRAIAGTSALFDRLQVVEITARPEVIAQRLAARGRESETDIAARLTRRVDAHRFVPGMVTLENNGTLEEAGARFVALVRRRIV